MAIVDELIAVLGYDLEGEGNLGRFQDGMRKAERGLNNLARAAARYGAIAAAAVGAAGTAFGKHVVSTSAMFEGFETALVTVEGSVDKARQSMGWITTFARDTPYELAGITDSFIRLRTYGIEPTDGTLRTLGDTASAMNKPLIAAVEMLADATTFQFERLREFGLTASQQGAQVTFRWMANGKQLTKTVKKNGEEVRKFILENLGDRFHGAMLRQSKTWNGMMSNLADAWTLFQKRVGDKGFFETVKGYLGDLLDYVDRLDRDGTLDRWAQNISNGLSALAETTAAFVQRIRRHAETIAKLFNGAYEAMQPWFGLLALLAARLFPVLTILTALGLAVDDFLTYLAGGESYIGDFIDALAEFLGAEPEQVAEVLANLAKAAGWMLAASLGIGLFAGALRSLATAMGLVWAMRKVVPLVAGLTGAGAVGAAGGAGAAAGGGGGIAGLLARFGGMKMLGRISGGLAIADILGMFVSKYRYDNSPEGQAAHRQTRINLSRNWEQSSDTGMANTQGPMNILGNMNRHLEKMSAGAAASAVDQTIQDNRQDNRQFPMTNNVTINQNVTQATDAPGAAARATGDAVGKAVAGQRSQIEAEPAF